MHHREIVGCIRPQSTYLIIWHWFFLMKIIKIKASVKTQCNRFPFWCVCNDYFAVNLQKVSPYTHIIWTWLLLQTLTIHTENKPEVCGYVTVHVCKTIWVTDKSRWHIIFLDLAALRAANTPVNYTWFWQYPMRKYSLDFCDFFFCSIRFIYFWNDKNRWHN